MGNLYDVERLRLDSFESVVTVLDASCMGVLRAILKTLQRRQQPITDSLQITEVDIGADFGRSKKTVQRAITKLKKASLLIVEEVTGNHGQRANRFAIPWATFEAIASGDEEAIPTPGQNDHPPRTKWPPPPDKMATPGGGQNDHPFMIHEMNNEMIHEGKDEIFKAEKTKCGGWPMEPTVAALRDPVTVKRLYEWAIRLKWLKHSQAARLGFFAAAVQAREKGKQPAKLFTSLVKSKAWSIPGKISGLSEQTAQREMDSLFKPPPVTRLPTLPADALAVPSAGRSADRSMDEQLAALHVWRRDAKQIS